MPERRNLKGAILLNLMQNAKGGLLLMAFRQIERHEYGGGLKSHSPWLGEWHFPIYYYSLLTICDLSLKPKNLAQAVFKTSLFE